MPSQPEPPRRSSRRPNPKKYSSYNVGDVVEIARNNVIANGRLVYKLSEGPTANPRWLVTFDRETWKDEELYERSFGKVIEKAPDSGDSTPPSARENTPNNRARNKNSRIKNSKPQKKSASGTSGSDEDLQGGKKKSVAFSEGSAGGSDNGDSSPLVDGKVSAREQRSLRRQAMIQEEVAPPDPQNPKKKRALDGLLKEGKAESGSSNGSIKRSKKDEEVVKIPMNTGTLYIYRGLHPRAAFVRRV